MQNYQQVQRLEKYAISRYFAALLNLFLPSAGFLGVRREIEEQIISSVSLLLQ